MAYLDKAAYQHHPASVPKEIYPSSCECDCGRQSHFFENTIRGIKAMSRKKKVRLSNSEALV